jgi:hypothetical protein
MSSKAAKFAPFCVVAGTLGYLCWPYFEDPAVPPQAKAKATAVVELTPAILSPTAAPALTRDPFGSEEAAQKLAASKADRKVGPASQAKPSAAKAEPEPPPPAEKPKIKPPSSLVLNGTYLRGDHRVAVINQAVYAEGERVKLADHAGVRCNLNQVEIDRVVLELDEGIAELSYPDLNPPQPAPNTAAPSPASAPTPAPAGENSSPTTIR